MMLYQARRKAPLTGSADARRKRGTRRVASEPSYASFTVSAFGASDNLPFALNRVRTTARRRIKD